MTPSNHPAQPDSSAAPRTILIRGAAAVMTGLPGARARGSGTDIRVHGSRIREVGRLAPQAGERVIDASDCVIYPGWVNTHHHLAQALLKGVPGGLNADLLQWLQAVPFRYRLR